MTTLKYDLSKMVRDLKKRNGVIQQLDIINPDLIQSEDYQKGLSTVEIIRENKGSHLSQTRLSDVLKNLPYGIIHKDETGMGATHLELQAERNSIIVEPIKITASSKAYHAKPNYTLSVLYVGSPTLFHTKKVYKNTILTYTKNPANKYKKIIVVADSLHKVIDAIGPSVFRDYFLLLDEADSYQLDSTYRKSMDECLDYYKRFPEDKRAMVSATINDFSDPELADEHKTVLRYEKNLGRKITVLQCTISSNLQGVVYDSILNCYKNNPEEKIAIAFNSVTNCLSLAEKLVGSGIIDDKSVGILCSKNSQVRADKYFRELQIDKLPCKINFLTSAYFTGFDLNESFHLISVSSIQNQIYTLSDKRLKQIAGRCRTGLYSETIIHDAKPADPKKEFRYTLKGLVKIAQTELDSLACLRNHYQKNILLKSVYETISDTIIKTLDQNKVSYIRKDTKKVGQYKISYLSIDARLENNKTRLELYQDISELAATLKKEGNTLKVIKASSSTVVDLIQINNNIKEEETKEVIEYLRTKPGINDLDYRITTEKLSTHKKKLLSLYKSYCINIEEDNLIDNIEEAAKSRDSRAIQNLSMALLFQVLNPGTNLVRNVNHYFPENIELTPDQIFNRMLHVFTDSSLPDKVTSSKNAVMVLNLFKKTKRNSKKGVYKVEGDNPYELIVTKRLPPVKDKITFSVLWAPVTSL